MNKIFYLSFVAVGLSFTLPAHAQTERKWNMVACTGTTTIGSLAKPFQAVFRMDENDVLLASGESLYGSNFSRVRDQGDAVTRHYKAPEGEGLVKLILHMETGAMEMLKIDTPRFIETKANCKKFVPSNVFN